jgi:hypothetical protein
MFRGKELFLRNNFPSICVVAPSVTIRTDFRNGWEKGTSEVSLLSLFCNCFILSLEAVFLLFFLDLFYFTEIFSVIFYFLLRIGIGFSNCIKIFCFFRTRQIHRKWKSGPKQKTFPQISSTSFKFGKFENNLALIQIQQKQKTEFRSNLLKNVLCRNRFKKSRLEQFPSKTGFDW